jgi:HK97 gp10 family phage protein
MKFNWHPEKFIEHTKRVCGDKLETVGEVVADEARRICPKDTGALAESIDTVRINETTIRIGASGSDKRNYAWYVEMGTSHNPSQSFLRVGLHNSKQEIDRIFNEGNNERA